MAKTGYAAPHTVHCGPDAIYINALGAPGGDGPGGIFMLDHDTFEVKGRWEKDRGPQHLAYDFWWHLGHDAMITSEWGTPNMVKDGVNPELLLAGKYGNALHVWDLKPASTCSAWSSDRSSRWCSSCVPRTIHGRPTDSSASSSASRISRAPSGCGTAMRRHGSFGVKKVIEIPAEPADASQLPPFLKGFGAVPPLVTDINLSLDDRFLYVSCWGTGELSSTT